MRQLTYNCDGCGTEKKESNHWIVARMTNVGVEFHTWAWAVREGQLEEDEKLRHLCGRKCAHLLLNEFLEKVAAPGNVPYSEGA